MKALFLAAFNYDYNIKVILRLLLILPTNQAEVPPDPTYFLETHDAFLLRLEHEPYAPWTEILLFKNI